MPATVGVFRMMVMVRFGPARTMPIKGANLGDSSESAMIAICSEDSS